MSEQEKPLTEKIESVHIRVNGELINVANLPPDQYREFIIFCYELWEEHNNKKNEQ